MSVAWEGFDPDSPDPRPSLTLREPTLGEVNFPGAGQIVEFEVPVNQCLRFDFGYPTAKAAREFFPVVETDSTIFNHGALGGIPFVDAMFAPTSLARGGLDTLYTMGAARDGVGGGGVSAFNGKPIAFRYADPDPIPAQGPVAILGFPLHFLKPGSAEARTGTHGLMRSLADWFRSRQVVSG